MFEEDAGFRLETDHSDDGIDDDEQDDCNVERLVLLFMLRLQLKLEFQIWSFSKIKYVCFVVVLFFFFYSAYKHPLPLSGYNPGLMITQRVVVSNSKRFNYDWQKRI